MDSVLESLVTGYLCLALQEALKKTQKIKGYFLEFYFYVLYDIQHCFICRPSDSTVSEDAEVEPRTVATIRHWLSDALTTGLDLIHLRGDAVFVSCKIIWGTWL